jgi:RimJ/RimL family protein N-acetyltransferase
VVDRGLCRSKTPIEVAVVSGVRRTYVALSVGSLGCPPTSSSHFAIDWSGSSRWPRPIGVGGRIVPASVESGRENSRVTVITTRRLVLRPALAVDIDALRRLASDPVVRRYLGGPADPAAVAAITPESLTPQWGSFVYAVPGGPVIGGLELTRERGELEVGYLQLPEFWGQGFAAEAVRGLLKWAPRQCPEDRVIAVTQAANVNSLALLARLGFLPREEFIEYGAAQILLQAPLPLAECRTEAAPA